MRLSEEELTYTIVGGFANGVSLLFTGVLCFLCNESIHHRESEDLAGFGLVLIGAATVFLQVILIFPISMFCLSKLMSCRARVKATLIAVASVVLPIIALAAISRGSQSPPKTPALAQGVASCYPEPGPTIRILG